MSDPQASSDTVTPRRRGPPLWLWLLLIVLAVLALTGWAGWRGWQLWQTQQQMQQGRFQTLHSQLEQARDEIKSMRAKLDKATDSAHHNSQDLTALQGRVDDIGRSVGSLGNVVRGGRERVQLDQVEQLLLTANDDVQLAHNPVTADRALAAADNRLAALDSPRLFDLRKTISQERSALQAVNEPDLTATALKLSQLIDQLPQLPLRNQPHTLKETTPADDHDKGAGWMTRGWHHLGAALRSLFHLRRTDHPIQPLLTQAQAPLVADVLSLRLDTARAALVQRNTGLYRSALRSAQQWLSRYYRTDDPAVHNGLDQLAKLSALDLDPPLPDISHSVDLLRSLRNNSSN